MSKPAKGDKLPPHSLEAEQGVLGCLMLSSREVMPECIEAFAKGSDVFYDLRHRTVYEVIKSMYDRDQPVDTITLQYALQASNQLDSIGGNGFLSSLPDNVPSAANIGHYIKIVVEKYTLRELQAFCVLTSHRIEEFSGDVEQILDDTEENILRINCSRSVTHTVRADSLIDRTLSQMDEVMSNPDKKNGIPTGFEKFDDMTLGYVAGDFHILAARPSLGKTSLALNCALHQSLQLKMPVGIISLEMKRDQLIWRAICGLAEVDSHKVRHGRTEPDEALRLAQSGKLLKTAPLYIDDERGIALTQLRAKIRRMVSQYGVKVVYIDYLQLVTIKHRRDNRAAELGEISGACKSIAGDLDIAVVALAQLNRDLEKDKKQRRPRVSDLRESGAIEQDADMVGLLHKPGKDIDEDDDSSIEDKDKWVMELIIGKQRNGPRGVIPLDYWRRWTTFKTKPIIDPEDHPMLPGVNGQIKDNWFIPKPSSLKEVDQPGEAD